MDGRHPIPGGQLLAMSVAGRLVAATAADVVQVLPMLPLWRPPTAPAPLCGFADSGGSVLPVLSARMLFGLGEETAPGLYAHIVRVQGDGGRQIGLLVDRVEGFVHPISLEPLDATETLNGCAIALFALAGVVGWLLDPGRLIGVAEGEKLAALAAEAERRRSEWAMTE